MTSSRPLYSDDALLEDLWLCGTLSTRSRNALCYGDGSFRTVGEVKEIPDHELMGIWGFGRRSLQEVRFLFPTNREANTVTIEQPEQIASVVAHTDLIGLWGHTYQRTEDKTDLEIEWQFQIIRKLDFGAYLIQLFSWLDGEPINVAVIQRDKLTGKNCKLYVSHELMRAAYEREERRKPRDERTDAPSIRLAGPSTA